MDVNRARKAELIDLAEKLGLDADGTVIELRKRLMDYEEAHDTLDEDDVDETLMAEDAVKDSEGAVAEMFPELEKVSDEDVDEAIDAGRRKEDEGDLESEGEEGEVLGTVSVSISMKEELAEAMDPEDAKEAYTDEELAEIEAESDEADAESVEAEIPDVPLAEDDEFTEEISKVHTPLEPCKNCGTDLERFPPFFDPESDASRCPNCGWGL